MHAAHYSSSPSRGGPRWGTAHRVALFSSSPSRGGPRWGWVVVLQCPPYRFLDRFDFTHYLVIPESQHPESRAIQIFRAGFVPDCVQYMLPAVDFDDRQRLQADNVENKIVERVLP